MDGTPAKPMVYRRRRILLSEIDRQCRFAMMAYTDASGALEMPDAERCWYSLQGLITAAKQLHQLLWPSPPSSLAWAKELRTALELGDDSPLNQPRLDEVLDVVLALETRDLARSGGPAEAAAAESVRSFDPETGAFTLFGNVVALPPLLNAIVELSQKTERELRLLREVV